MQKHKLTIGNFQSGYPDPDGITTAVYGLSRGLARSGHSVTIYGCGQSSLPSARHAIDNLNVILAPRAGRNPFHISESLLKRIARNEDRLDLLLIHGMFNPPNVRVARAAIAGRIPYVVCPHGPFHPALLSKHRLRKAIYGVLLERPQLRRAAAVQLFCPAQTDYLKSYGIVNACLVLPNGFDPECIPQMTTHSCELNGDPKFLFLGRLDTWHKGLDILIQAFMTALRNELIPPTTSLTIVGPGDRKRQELVRFAARHGGGSNIHFKDAVSGPDKWALLRSCDVMVLCSRYEGFAMAGIEAMCAVKPLLLSTEAGNAHWVREADCAFIVRPTTASVCAGLVEAVRNRHRWQQMGLNGIAFAMDYLTWDKIAKDAAGMYAELLNRPLNCAVQ